MQIIFSKDFLRLYVSVDGHRSLQEFKDKVPKEFMLEMGLPISSIFLLVHIAPGCSTINRS